MKRDLELKRASRSPNRLPRPILGPRSSVWSWVVGVGPAVLAPCSLAVYMAGSPVASAAMPDALQAVRAVGPEGRGNAEATPAWRELAAADPAALPALLAAMDGANEIAANWLRTAADAVVDRALQAGQRLPVPALGSFLLDPAHDPRARRLAFEILGRVEPQAAAALVPGFLSDPAPDLRRDAVEGVITQAVAQQAAGRPEAAILLFRQALGHAREVDQIEQATQSLRGLGQTVDLPHLLGFITRWKVIGPFDNTGMRGFQQAFPPEQALDLQADYEGKGARARWVDLVAQDDFGFVDLNQPFGKLKEVCGYAVTTFQAEARRPVELRLGSENAWKLWLNGQLLFARDEYHRGRAIDQYRIPATLQPGPNTLLVKVCQDALVEDWTVEWQFQLRITDPLGTPVRPAAMEPPQP